jgi:hypothetical protein
MIFEVLGYYFLVDTYFIMKKSYPNPTISSNSNALLNSFKKQLFFIFAFFALTNYSFGQGTTCSNATNISINGSCLSSNSNALTGNDSNPSFVNCQNNGNVNNVRWYTFTVTGGPLSVTITAIGNRNLAFQLIGSTTNNCSNLSEIQCVNNVNGTGNNDSTETTTNLLTNGTYFIKILNNANNNNLDLTSLCVTGVAPENTVPSTGNNAYTLCSGNLYDNGGSSGNYVNDSNGYTVLNPSIAGNRIRVSGTLNTEGGFDYMTIYDGVGIGGTILWGGAPHGSGTSCTPITVPTITSTTGSLTIRFQSNFSNVCAGFNLTVSCITTPVPTITSLSSTSGCVGSSLTITGTNLSTASSVTIGGTPATITANSATSITVTVGTGTTGNVLVTTSGGTATSAATFTVNPLPANPGNPTSNSPQCNPPGVTITRNGSPAAGITWYWQTTALGTTTTNSGATYNVTTSGTYYIRAQNNTTGCWSTGSGSVTVSVVSATAITSNPANSSIAVGANTSFSVVASNSPSSYTWQVSTNGGGTWSTVANGGVYSNATTATLNITNATFVMNGYLYRASATNSCGTSSFSNSALLTVNLVYCTPSSTNSIDYISSFVTSGGITNINNPSAGISGTGYGNFYATFSASQFAGSSLNFTEIYQGGNHGFSIWVDLNNNGTFETSERLYNAATLVTGHTGTITIPLATTAGDYRMRIRAWWNNLNPDPCTNISWGEAEDYKLTVVALTPCTTPSAQPTVLVLTPSNNTITGSFTAAVPAPNNYLVVMNTSATPPTLTNGTTYTIGSTIGAGYTVIDTDSNTTFSATGLSASTKYYFYVYSFNSLCSGGPLYLSTSPLTGNATTPATSTYCIPTVTSGSENSTYTTNISFVGTLNDISNNSTFSTSPNGYQDFTGLVNKAIQAQGEGVNVSVQNTFSTYIYAWVDWNRNGSFTDPGEQVYTTNGVSTASTSFGYIIPPTQAVGNYRIRIRSNTSSGTSTLTPCGTFANQAGETEDYLFTVIASCSANIATITNGVSCGAGPVTLTVTGTAGTTSYKWYTTETGNTAISGAISSSYTTPTISVTTTYYVTALNGTCESLIRIPIVAKINPTPVVTFNPPAPVVCGDNTIISLTAGGDNEIVLLINEKFESGTLGTFTNTNIINNSAVLDNKSQWQNRTSTFIPAEQVWYPAISSGFGTNKFALSTSDIGSYTVHNQLASATVNSTNFTNLALNLKMYYSRYYQNGTFLTEDYITIDVSRDGGATWPFEIIRYTSDLGVGTKFSNLNFDLSAHINQPNLKVRVRYYGVWCDGVAIDDVELFGSRPLNASFNYNTSVVDAYTDFACTIPYIAGNSATIIHIKPTVIQLENASFTIPVTTTLTNGCTANGSVTVTNNTKLFTPSAANSDWNTASNWKPVGVPTASNCIAIYKDVNITGPNNTEKGLNLTVKAGKTLNIAPDNSLVITDFINVEPTGTFQIENNSNLVQINNVVNTGNIIYKRIAPSIKGSDYVYWSSPVANQAISTFYTSPTQGPKYQWNTTVPNGNGGQGNWQNPPATMANGSGYIIRGSSSFGMPATNINATFTGRPNNGNIQVTVNRGNYTGLQYAGTNGVLINNLDDNYNLIGNPYPSAINALQFLSDNAAVIEGNVKLWKHGIDAANGATNPFYGTYAYNYSGSDYVTINFTGPTTPTSTDIIKSGQAFFVEMLDGVAGSGTVNFNNTTRRNSSNLPYANDNFFRNSNQQTTSFENVERHRIWLDILDANNKAETTLLGYVSGATVTKDSAYDAIASTLTMGIYSFINNESFVIQGRNLPFDDNDQVAIGFNVPSTGTYKIAINTADGLFLGTQDVYLKDELLNIYHDLKSAPYSFTATAGIHDTRFKLVYKNTVLSNVTFNENEIQIAKNRNFIEIVSGSEIMENVKVFDIRGRLLVEKTKINTNSVSIDTNNIQDQVLIINIVTSKGIKVTRKIL